MKKNYPLLLCCLAFSLPGRTQQPVSPLDAVDRSVHNAVAPVAGDSLHSPDLLNASPNLIPVSHNAVTPLTPFHWTPQPTATTWFPPLKSPPPPLESPAKTSAKPSLNIVPVFNPVSVPAPSTGFSNPFFLPSFGSSTPFRYPRAAKTKPRKSRTATASPAR